MSAFRRSRAGGPRHASKKHYLFDGGVTRFTEAECRDGIQLDDVGMFSTTAAPVAQQISKHIANLFTPAERARGLSVTDGCACCGGNVLSFARCGFFAKVTAVEFDAKRHAMLASNVKFALRGVASPPVTDVRCGSYLDLLRVLKQDVVFLDPPWGGIDYKKEKFVPLFLGDRHLADIVNDLRRDAARSGTKCVVLKVPRNFHIAELRDRLALPVPLLAPLKKMDLYVVRFPAGDPLRLAAEAAAATAAAAPPESKKRDAASAADGGAEARGAKRRRTDGALSADAAVISMHLYISAGRPSPEFNGAVCIADLTPSSSSSSTTSSSAASAAASSGGAAGGSVAERLNRDRASRARDHATTVITVEEYSREALLASAPFADVHCPVPPGEDPASFRDLRKFKQLAAYLHERKKSAVVHVKASSLKLRLTSRDEGRGLRLHCT